MTRNRVFHSALMAVSVLMIAGCAAQPPATPASSSSVEGEYFQREASNYQKFRREGQTVYCSAAETSSDALIPYIGYVLCISEPELRESVRDSRRDRRTFSSRL